MEGIYSLLSETYFSENTPCLVTSESISPGVGGGEGNSTPRPVTRTLAPEIFVSPPTENI